MSGPYYVRTERGLVAYTRHDRSVHAVPFGPKVSDHPSVGRACVACGAAFAFGDYTTLVPVGPGDDPAEQQRAREGRVYNSVAVEVHWTCATGLPVTVTDGEVQP